jgi:methylamine dehydrogenase accessory protein MauD
MRGSAWVASYVALWLTVLVLAFAVVALLRQIGVLHARLHPLGAHFGGEGPELGAVAPLLDGLDYAGAAVSLVAFTSPSCAVCAVLRPSVDAIARAYRDVQVRVVDLDDGTRAVFDAFNVRSTPYFVAVGPDGAVRARGVANSLEQIEELLEEARVEAS